MYNRFLFFFCGGFKCCFFNGFEFSSRRGLNLAWYINLTFFVYIFFSFLFDFHLHWALILFADCIPHLLILRVSLYFPLQSSGGEGEKNRCSD